MQDIVNKIDIQRLPFDGKDIVHELSTYLRCLKNLECLALIFARAAKYCTYLTFNKFFFAFSCIKKYN